MKISLINHSSSRSLLLIFSGWACDERLFTDLSTPDYSTIVVSDYTDFASEELYKTLLSYSEICVIAWSYGVPHAAEFLATYGIHLPITLSIAINGTISPVDNSFGIPTEIFNATLKNLSSSSLRKFYRRICQSSQVFNSLPFKAEDADINILTAELNEIGNRQFPNAHKWIWDHSFISDVDRIIPPINQLNAWKYYKNVINIHNSDWAHLPDFKSIVSGLLINKQLVRKRFKAVSDTYSHNAPVQRHMAEILANKLNEECYGRTDISLLEFGVGAGDFTSLYYPNLARCINSLCLIDIAGIDKSLPGSHINADAELKIREFADNSLDIICGSATIQWFNSPFTFVRECYRVLKPGGLLLFSTFSENNFPEISKFAPSLPLSSKELWMRELSGIGFQTKIYSETTPLHFQTPRELLEHLRLTGVNSIQSDSKLRLRAANRILRENIHTLTYAPLYIVASKL